MAGESEEQEGTLLRGVRGDFRGKLYFIRHDDLTRYEVEPIEKSKAEKFIKRFGQANPPIFSETRVYPIANVIKTDKDFRACDGQESNSE